MTTINTNMSAITAQANMTRVNDDMNAAMSRLSSGLRINAAKDDAAGMAIAEKMTSQITGLNQAVRNATDGKNLLDTTEGAHVEVSNMLQRLRELAVQSSNDTNTASDRSNLGAEAKQLVTEINRVAKDTTFNGMKILDGSYTGKQFQIGADAGQVLNISVDSAAATDIGAHTVTSNVSLAAGAGTSDTGITAASTINITGFAGSAELTTSAGQSAEEMAAAINNVSASTGVTASATTNLELSSFSAADTVTFDVNGVNIGTVAISDTSDLRGVATAINNQSGRTGVTATMGDDNSSIKLTDATGADILITDFTTGTGGSTMAVTAQNSDGTAAGATAGTHTATLDDTDNDVAVSGQVELSSTKQFSVGTDETTAGEVFFESAATTSELSSVAEIDLTTLEGAASALKVIDVALQKVSQSRSDLGAVSNRLDSTISNLTNITVNVQAARSGVMDADFAKESSEMARSQILSQASTAMLAQANQSAQGMLSLLR
ncbi:Flagellin [Roseovarius sp. EC-HK134]|uniref:Flagellin n=1 Tax=Roseovarius mucosus TaxID=215743 RepID=A0A1V0RSE1_9RHOB|nr:MULTISPECIES: flagellin [Roseovarius]ARE84683.1 B-type flagellin [Roseovarius mucosus]MBW4973968.1 flagellar filament protein [Roseovarius mucosus]VVT20692.1 Flagellin [Roseovarius sp. EC-SD190]VVT20801.1 Flagellin [Roseovarius sp. EC-HK134]|tara:strand:+ start:2076 stop:3554 length:1479 start_codon:yes stop_codon:yes gene_type:complete